MVTCFLKIIQSHLDTIASPTKLQDRQSIQGIYGEKNSWMLRKTRQPKMIVAEYSEKKSFIMKFYHAYNFKIFKILHQKSKQQPYLSHEPACVEAAKEPPGAAGAGWPERFK